MNAPRSATEYDERLGVPLRWWVQGVMFAAAFWLALIVAVPEPAAWAIVGVVLLILAGCLLSYGALRIVVKDGFLRVGRARIGVEHLGAVTTLDAAATRATAGVHADARAYLALRPYLKASVRVEITDPADPVPYWLVCTRHPERLAEVLAAATAHPRPGT